MIHNMTVRFGRKDPVRLTGKDDDKDIPGVGFSFKLPVANDVASILKSRGDIEEGMVLGASRRVLDLIHAGADEDAIIKASAESGRLESLGFPDESLVAFYTKEKDSDDFTPLVKEDPEQYKRMLQGDPKAGIGFLSRILKRDGKELAAKPPGLLIRLQHAFLRPIQGAVGPTGNPLGLLGGHYKVSRPGVSGFEEFEMAHGLPPHIVNNVAQQMATAGQEDEPDEEKPYRLQ